MSQIVLDAVTASEMSFCLFIGDTDNASDRPTAAVIERLTRAQLPNDRLLDIGQRNRPPQKWYDRDEEELF